MCLKTKKIENVFLKSNLDVASNVFFVKDEEEIILKIKQAYLSNVNSKRENKLLIITDKKIHYVAVIKLPPFFWQITSNHDKYFYFLSCLNLFPIEESHDSYGIIFKDSICFLLSFKSY